MLSWGVSISVCSMVRWTSVVGRGVEAFVHMYVRVILRHTTLRQSSTSHHTTPRPRPHTLLSALGLHVRCSMASAVSNTHTHIHATHVNSTPRHCHHMHTRTHTHTKGSERTHSLSSCCSISRGSWCKTPLVSPPSRVVSAPTRIEHQLHRRVGPGYHTYAHTRTFLAVTSTRLRSVMVHTGVRSVLS